ncbi:MAG TPA: hypothetical protein VNS29_15415 [Burkholderiaceae bacterium]|nr:hypothetical protein [Burkholderiaceae bacterium]
MMPAWLLTPAARASIAAGLLALAFAAGWAINGWRAAAQIAELRQGRAESAAQGAQKVLDDIEAAARKIAASAASYAGARDTLTASLNKITKELTSAKPLPADCAPDSERVRLLGAAVDAAKQAAAAR